MTDTSTEMQEFTDGIELRIIEAQNQARAAILKDAFFKVVEHKGPVSLRDIRCKLNSLGSMILDADIPFLCEKGDSELRKDGKSLLMAAQTPEAIHAIEAAGMIKNGVVNVRSTDKDGNTALHYPSSTPQVIVALAEIGVPLETKNNFDQTPLVGHSRIHRYESITRAMTLLLLGANVNATFGNHGNALIHLVNEIPADYDPHTGLKVRMVTALVEAGATAAGALQVCKNSHVRDILETAVQTPRFTAAEDLLAAVMAPHAEDPRSNKAVKNLLADITRVRGILEERKAKAATDATRATAVGNRAVTR